MGGGVDIRPILRRGIFFTALASAALAGLLAFIPFGQRIIVLSLILTFISPAFALFFAHSNDKSFAWFVALAQIMAASLVSVIVPKSNRLIFVLYTAALVAVIQGGSVAVSLYRTRTLDRLSRAQLFYIGADLDRSLTEGLEIRARAYYGLLPGFIAGAVLGRLLPFPWAAQLTFPLTTALLAAAGVLAFELVVNARQLLDPFLAPIRPESRNSSNGVDERRWRLGVVGLRQRLPVGAEERSRVLQHMACAVSDVRTIVFWSSVYACSILVSLLLMSVHLIGTRQSIWTTVVAALAGVFLLVQLPYVFGQRAAHLSLLSDTEGVDRAELQEKLEKCAPLVPRAPILAALAATGTAGGVVYVVLEKILESILTAPRPG